ncbi:MAG: hypothetical protein RJB66_2632 [Pseudomonadota bacterium]|jgi:hypothetical protein
MKRRIFNLTFISFSYLTLASFLSACSGNLKDPVINIGDSPDGILYTRPTPSPTPTGRPGSGGDGVGGDCYENPDIGRFCEADGGTFGNDAGVITVNLLNFNGGEAVKGGGSYFIKYKTTITYEKFKSVYSKIELKKQSEPDTAWKVVGEKITSNDGELVEFNWNVCPSLQVESCERTNSGELVSVNGSDYQLRVTSQRLANQSGSKVSTGTFAIDSASPVLSTKQTGASPKGFVAKVTQPNNGFINLELKGATDNLSTIKSICLKTNSAAPEESNGCWIPVTTFKAVKTPIAGGNELNIETLPVFVGFGAIGINYYVWLMDVAGNISKMSETLLDDVVKYGINEKDVLSLSRAAISFPGRDSFWQPGSASQTTPSYSGKITLKTIAGASAVQYSGHLDDNFMADPGSLVVTSAGVAYIKSPDGVGTTKGVLKFDLNAGEYKVLLAQGNHTVGAANGTTAKVYDPLRIALDSNEDLWVMDKKEDGKVVISKVTGLAGDSPVMADVIGGGVNTNTADKAALDLQIDYSDDFRHYGTFAALPGGLLVFSSDSPVRALAPLAPTARFQLRVYYPERALASQIATILISSTDLRGAELNTPSGYPLKAVEGYGTFGVSYDWSRHDVGYLYGRGCAPMVVGSGRTCSELVNMVFDHKGQLVSFLPTQGPWLWGNETLTVSKQKNLYALNAYRGRLSVLRGAALDENWIDVFATSGVGANYCANGTVAGQCAVRVKDVFIGPTGRVYFIDEQRLRFIDEDGSVQSLLSFE